MPSPPRNLKPLPGLPQYEWNQQAGRYVDAKTKRFVAWQSVGDQYDKVVNQSDKMMRALSQQLRDGDLSLDEWQSAMMGQVKITHLSAMILQKGGIDQLTQADYGRVGQVVRGEYELLRNFARQIANGSQKLDGTLLRRAEMYGQAGRSKYYGFHDKDKQDRGFDEERSILNPADHCIECVSEADKGWVSIGTLIPIGSRICRSGCKCDKEYRNSVTGETIRV